MDQYPSQGKRIIWIDQARGVALLGILLANMLLFQYGMWGNLSVKTLETYDYWAYELLRIFVVDSFMPLFAFLFSYGIVLMKDRFDQKGLGAYRIVFVRRFLILIGLGLLHCFFVWDGDILRIYGIIGIGLVFLFINRKPKTILMWAIILFVTHIFVIFGLRLASPDQLVESHRQTAEIMQNGSYWENVFYRINGAAFFHLDDSLPSWASLGLSILLLVVVIIPVFVLSPFLFGMYVAKKRWLHKPQHHIRRIRKVFFVSLVLSIPLKALPIFWDTPFIFIVSDGVGPLALTFCYISGIILLMETRKGQRVLKPFGIVGKLSLTNYLFQSIIMTTIFYGYGLGLYGKLGVWVGIGLAVLFFLCQIVASFWWTKRFQMGPFEWLWRLGTYHKVPAIMRKSNVSK
ncbi:DUF418 domain-containing protein [Bacillus sp. WMMC1349]|uniref:DUF418 domain-containing protein n=1 Tax=Bacillus sp. WMMC1349 TaxID=2736254 RepID=UPI001554F577|nr:DUF418 domain-containing protein [Bacillus sp. WMMC1349]NPC94609.1 DUF418 domain-containing protein [Bacillus sp. WMMC1349]